MQTACYCPAPVRNFQPSPTTTTQLNNNSSDFDTEQSLTGDKETDQLLTGLLLGLVQLLMQQFGENQQQSSARYEEEATEELNFNETDKQHLLNALDVNTENTQVGKITDNSIPGYLSEDDNVELIRPSSEETHGITDSEVSQFINLRNPPGTPKLDLSPAQVQQIATQFNIDTGVSVADNNGDGILSAGDHIGGQQTQGEQKLQVDILVDDNIANSLKG